MLLRGLCADVRIAVGEVVVIGREQMPDEGDAGPNCFAASLSDEARLTLEVLNPCGLFVVSRGGAEQAHPRGETAFLEAGDEIRVGQTTLTVEREGGKRARVAVAAPPSGAHTTLLIGGELRTAGVALGTLQLGVSYPAPRMPRDEAIALVRAALAAGVTLFDTSDAYCRNGSEMGYVESLVAEALAGQPQAIIATKGGMQRHMSNEESHNTWLRPVASPEKIEALIRASHARLGGKRPIPLWQVHHADEKATLPVMRAAQRMQKEGLISHLGVCNVSLAQLEALRADGIRIATVQNEFSIWTRTASSPNNGNKTGKTGILEYCRHHGLVFLAYSPLGGLKTRRGERDLARDFPQFAAEAKNRGCDPCALLMATMRRLFPEVVLLVGTRRADRAAQLLDFEHIALTEAEARKLWPATK
jgi:aryl-alcohol dehydrogenase-like predicted oxidoreductase